MRGYFNHRRLADNETGEEADVNMLNSRRSPSTILVNLTLVVLLLAQSTLPALAQTAQPAPAAEPPPQTPTKVEGLLFRTRVTLRTPADRTRLEQLGAVILGEGSKEEREKEKNGKREQGSRGGTTSASQFRGTRAQTVAVLADAEQLETLARLGFHPESTDALDTLVASHAQAKPWLAAGLQPLLSQAVAVAQQRVEAEGMTDEASLVSLRNTMRALTPEQQDGLASLISLDDDADGLTNTQETWWCTDPLNADTDGDGTSDGDEIAALKAWVSNEADNAPGETPWPDWPPQRENCPDKDHDSIPNLAEAWELGLNMDRESTDRDKFDDGQELFGTTYCPGGDLSCGYGDLPRSADSGYVGRDMPDWVDPPGNHPLVAAFPVPEVSVVPNSWTMDKVTEITTEQGVITRTTATYEASATRGQKTGIEETVTWNEWEEVSEAVEQPLPEGVTLASANAQTRQKRKFTSRRVAHVPSRSVVYELQPDASMVDAGFQLPFSQMGHSQQDAVELFSPIPTAVADYVDSEPPVPDNTIEVQHGQSDLEIVNLLPDLELQQVVRSHPLADLPAIEFRSDLKGVSEDVLRDADVIAISNVLDTLAFPDTLILFSNGWYDDKLQRSAEQMGLGLTEEQLFALESIAVARSVNTRFLLAVAKVKNAPNQFKNDQAWLKWLYLETTRIRAALGPFGKDDFQTIRFRDGITAYMRPETTSPSFWALATTLSAGKTSDDTQTAWIDFQDVYKAHFGDPTVDEARPAAAAPFLHKPYRVALQRHGYYDHKYPSIDNRPSNLDPSDPDYCPLLWEGLYPGRPNDENCEMLDYLGRNDTLYDTHDGDDFWMEKGEVIYAPVTGTAYRIPSGCTTSCTGYLIIPHSPQKYQVVIAHLSVLTATNKAEVIQDQTVLGESGEAGGVEHIHFEVRHNGKQTDTRGWYGEGNDPCPSGPPATGEYPAKGEYYGCEASVWLWADEDPPNGDTTPDTYGAEDAGTPGVLHKRPGESFDVTISVRNAGTATWRESNQIRLGLISWNNKMGAGLRHGLSPGETVAPEATRSWTIHLTAPSTPGTYWQAWQMVREDGQVGWFGDQIRFEVRVEPASGCQDVVAVGAGPSRQQLFVEAYDRNEGRNNVGCTEGGTYWWAGSQGAPSEVHVVRQDFTGQSHWGDAAIIHDEQRDDPAGSVPAYVVHGGILGAYHSQGGPAWIGPPTSDEFVNRDGNPQSNFRDGYISWVNDSPHYSPWPMDTGDWQAVYFNGRNLGAYPTWVQYEGRIDHDWGEQAPGGNCGLVANAGCWGLWRDHFSARWTKTVYFDSGEYRFKTWSDDGVRLYIDGQRVIDEWHSGGGQSYEVVRDLTAGDHEVRLEYFEDWGPAYVRLTWEPIPTPVPTPSPPAFGGFENNDEIQDDIGVNNYYIQNENNAFASAEASAEAYASLELVQNFDMQGVEHAIDGVAYAIGQHGELVYSGLSDISRGLDEISGGLDRVADGLGEIGYQLARPRLTETRTQGRSWGGAQTTIHEEYEEHTITEAEAFTTGRNWSTAWALNSSHAAELRFTYTVENTGTEYTHELRGLVFNVYLGDDEVPIISYPAWGQFPDGVLENLFPGDSHEFTTEPIILNLEQMRRIDTGERLRIVVEDYSYGVDENFYQNALNGGVTVYVEDGVADDDELVDRFLIPTWGSETVQDVLLRYFPAEMDADGDLTRIWTPEFGSAGAPTWREHHLSEFAWWNVYLTQPDAGNTPLQVLPAEAGSALLFRFGQDADRDGYNDRTERRYGTDRHDPASHPTPEMLAGYYVEREGNDVTVLLKLSNSGAFDAHNVQAVMYAPDNTTTVLNNTVGGNGRVRAGSQVVVGSRFVIGSADLANWQTSSARPYAAGNYTGAADRTYTFAVQTDGLVGQGGTSMTWQDDGGHSGTLDLGSSYHAPLPVPVGEAGLEMGFDTGRLEPGEEFTVQALTPRDTFRYQINAGFENAYTEPVIVVSYSDPQGSHRFVTQVVLASLDEDLASHTGEMLEDMGLRMVTTAPFDPEGSNTLHFLLDQPHPETIRDGHVFVDIVGAGEVVHEITSTLDIAVGPTVETAQWSAGDFDPPYDETVDYLVMAFWTDRYGNIIDSVSRRLSNLAADKVMRATVLGPAWDAGAVRWPEEGFRAASSLMGASHTEGVTKQSGSYRLLGSAGQPAAGTRMQSRNYGLVSGYWAVVRARRQAAALTSRASLMTVGAENDALERFPTHCFPIANTGWLDLQLEVAAVDEDLTITQPPAGELGTGEATELCVRLDTDGLDAAERASGEFGQVVLHTNDPAQPEIALEVSGSIETSWDVAFVYDYEREARPLTKIAHVNGTRFAGEPARFQHGVGGDVSNLHPLFVYAGDDATALGRGVVLGSDAPKLRQMADAVYTELTLTDSTTARRDYVVRYGYLAHLPGGGGQHTYQVPLPNRTYDGVTWDLVVQEPAANSVTVSMDVGADGSIEWTHSGGVSLDNGVGVLPVSGAAVTAAVNEYLDGQGGNEVFVPIRLTGDVAGSYYLANVRGAYSTVYDLVPVAVGVIDPTPTETEVVQICPGVENRGAGELTTVLLTSYVDDPAVGTKVLAGHGLQGLTEAEGDCIEWDTAGYTGEVTVYAHADYRNQVAESDDRNNWVSEPVRVRTRPDLAVPGIELSDPEPVAGEAVTVRVPVSNAGQTDAGPSTLALFEGDPELNGVLIGESRPTVLSGAETTLVFSWTPAAPGPYQLVAASDQYDEVDENDEGNNRRQREVYVGVAGPIWLDSGGDTDLAYTAARGYGYLDGEAGSLCGSAPAQTWRSDSDGEVRYRFDHLLAGHYYHLDLTLFECDNRGRQETVLVDGNEVLTEPVDLGDGEVHQVSIRLDPALYSDHSVTVAVQELLGNNSVVAGISLHDVDYRYADAGGTNDPSYAPEVGYGWLDGEANQAFGTLPYQTRRVDNGDNEVRYQFDHLDPAKRYQVHLTFYQGAGADVRQQVLVDGEDTGTLVELSGEERADVTVDVPPEAYATTSSIVVTIQRADALTGAFVNEIALEEETISVPPAEGARLYLEPGEVTKGIGQIFTLDLRADTGDDTADTVDAYLDFDPTYLEVVDATGAPATAIELNTGVFGSATENAVDNGAGQIDFSATKLDGTLSGDVKAATIRFKTKAEVDTTQVDFVRSGSRVSDLYQGGVRLNATLADGTVHVDASLLVLSGRVALERRGAQGDPRWETDLYRESGSTSTDGVRVYEAGTDNLAGTYAATTDANGRFAVGLTGLAAGTYDVSVKGANTLSNKRMSISLPSDTEVDFGTLRVGDSNGDDRVNGADVSYMVPSFLKCEGDDGFRPYGDTNKDGCINGADVSSLVPNFLAVGDDVSATEVSAQGLALASDASLALSPSSASAEVGDIVTLEIVADTGTGNADTVDVYLDFEPAYLEVVDETGAPATSIELNTAVFQGATFNAVDNAAGQINFSATKFDGSLSGVFTAATVRLRVKAVVAATDVIFVRSGARMSDLYQGGEPLGVTLTDGRVINNTLNARIYLPLIRRASE